MLGVPTEMGGELVSALPLRAYNRVYNEFYRDQDLISEISEDQTSLQLASWQKDYFTTARASPQQGSAVTFNISGEVPIDGIGFRAEENSSSQTGVRYTDASSEVTETGFSHSTGSSNGDADFFIREDPDNVGYPDIRADLGNIGVSIEAWRQAFGLQRFAELRARFGARYTDYLRMLGISPGDQRLQRPELIGSDRANVAFSEVLATASEGSSTSVGDLAGHAIAGMGRKKYRAFFPEHGYVLSLCTFRPIAIYANAIERHWLYRTYTDYFQPELELLGPQQVTNRELKVDHASPTDVFGYVERNNHLRRSLSQVMGLFRTSETPWHFSRDFGSDPALNQTFLECVPPTDPFANESAPQIYANIAHDLLASRIIKQRAKI